MFKEVFWSGLVVLLAALLPARASSTTVFDFEQIQSTSKKGATGADVEVYMEGLYGSDLSVSQKATAVRGPSIYNNADLDNSYLKIGKGKGPSAIFINFEDDPIESFSLDFKLFRKAKNFSILADGELINRQSLTKAQKKSGLSGHQNAYFFDKPVHTLQFAGLKKKSFAIDNLAVNLPNDLDGGLNFGHIGASFFTDNFTDYGDPELTSLNAPLGDTYIGETNTLALNQVTADIPEPSSILLLALGSFGLTFFRRARR